MLDCVIVAQEFGKVNLLFGSLFHLRHEVPEALVIYKNHKRMTQKVVSPLMHCCSYGMKFTNVF